MLFDLGSAVLRPADKPKIAEAVEDREGAPGRPRSAWSAKPTSWATRTRTPSWRSERSQAVAGELIRAGYPAKDIVIAADPEAFGNMSFGGNDASEKDRRVTILFALERFRAMPSASDELDRRADPSLAQDG